VITRHDGNPNAYVGNVGAVTANYRIYKYIPRSGKVPNGNWPTTLAGNNGTWTMKAVHTVDSGLQSPVATTNAHVYGNNYDRAMIGSTYATGWKIELIGPLAARIQVGSGGNCWGGCAGACNLHDSSGAKVGTDFWIHHAAVSGCGSVAKGSNMTLYINVFCPKTGMSVGIQSTDGMSAAYTTDGPDQVIVFMGITNTGSPDRRNYLVKLRPGVTGSLITQFQQSAPSEKAFTAPFVETGTHYELILPPTVYSGENFWFTIVVVESGGDTMTTYNGITSFTSTDSKAQLGGMGMDLYNYTWTGAGVGKDNGVKIFVNVIFNKLGLQTIVAGDTADGSIVGVGTIMVVGVDVKLYKEQRLTIAASGDTVQFKICWSNYSSASAFTFVITDAVPMGTTYVPETAAAMSCGSTDGMTITVGYSSDPTTPATTWATASGMLPTGVRWLKWTVPYAGVQTSGCACFKVSVN